jgi:hypothetical protein
MTFPGFFSFIFWNTMCDHGAQDHQPRRVRGRAAWKESGSKFGSALRKTVVGGGVIVFVFRKQKIGKRGKRKAKHRILFQVNTLLLLHSCFDSS